MAANGHIKRKRGKRAVSLVRTPRRRPTDTQLAFLEAVAALTQELGYAPSATEIGKRTGYTRTGARRLLLALAARGLCEDVPKVVSSGKWTVTERGAALTKGSK